MKLSNYTQEVQLDEENYLLYNTMSRKYYQYIKSEKNKLWKILSSINKDTYSLGEIKLLQELMSKHIIIDDNEDEMRKLEYLENTMFYKNDVFHVTVYATNACNFRCTYCSQEHAVKNIENDTVKNLIDVVKRAAAKYKKIIISWFGGEPLLQYEKIISMLSEMNKICITNNCILESDMVTNGYLLNEKMIEEMKEMHIRVMQITVDGCKSIHDKRRVLADKNGTYDKIVENIIKVAKVGIKIILRINIDKESLDKNMDVLDDIPYQYRKLINIDVENIFENKGSNSVYSILLRAIEMGYNYPGRYNNYAGCWNCGNNSLVVNTNGDVMFCTNSESLGAIGSLRENGKIQYKNKTWYEQNLMKSARDNVTCKECKELPFCIGNCRLARLNDNSKCKGKHNDGLSLEERVRLDYYYDCKHKNDF